MATPDSTDLRVRSEAKSAGLAKYPSTRPCKRCLTAVRFTDGKCVECNRVSCQRREAARKAAIPGKLDAIASMRARAKERAEKKATASQRAGVVRQARQAAIAGGLLTYQGRVCPKGHAGLRYTKHGSCTECAALQAASAEKKAYDKARYESVKEHVRARSAAYYAANAERAKKTSRAWVERNRDRRRDIIQSYKHRRRATENAGISGAELGAWRKAQKKVCYWCGVKCEKGHVVDHYEPLSKGGKHEVSNLVIACRPCNAQKSAKDPLEFAKARGRLF